jgi:hypothetical protein
MDPSRTGGQQAPAVGLLPQGRTFASVGPPANTLNGRASVEGD